MGRSAMEVAQPPSASADSSTAPQPSTVYLRPVRSTSPLQADAFFISFGPQCQNLCRPRRLKLEQQSEPLPLQYDRTKMVCRSAIHRCDDGFRPCGVDDEPELNL